MFTQVRDPAFRVTKVIIGEGDAILFWTFHFRFKGMGCKSVQKLEGVSHLAFDTDGLITLHRDYWDAAEELYSRLPVIGSLMRGLQRMIRA
jgi:steroid delta-isomerase